MRRMMKLPVLVMSMLLTAAICAGVAGYWSGTSPTLALQRATVPMSVWELLEQELAAPVEALARVEAAPVNRNQDLNLLARVIAAEAQGEPPAGQAAVAAVILNRVRHPSFPNTLSGVIFQPHAFESVSNGLIWRRSPDQQAVAAARQALNGWDPTYGCIFFWNPSKPVSRWIWTRQIVTRIGGHVFAR